MFKLEKTKSVKISKWLKQDMNLMDIASQRMQTCTVKQKIRDVLPILANKYRRVPVLDGEGFVKGMLSATDILHVLGGWGKYKKISPEKRLDVRINRVVPANLMHLDKNVKISTALDLFKKNRFGAYPILYRKKLSGIISEWDFVRQIRGKTGIKVSSAMVQKPIVAQEKYPVNTIAKMVCMGGFRRLPVVNDGILVGIVSPRDILAYLIKYNLVTDLEREHRPVKHMMTKPTITIEADADIFEAVRIMITRKIGGIPIVEDHEVMGIITERDIVDIIEF